MKVKQQTLYLVSELVSRDLKARYAGSTFGPTWAFLVPLAWVLIYSFVFSAVLRIPLTGEPAGVNFPEYLLAGFLPWLVLHQRPTGFGSDHLSGKPGRRVAGGDDGGGSQS